MSQSEPFYIFNTRLIDGSGENRKDRPFALLIRGVHIEAVAPQHDLPCPEGAKSLDAKGFTVMPGLIDCHEHMATMPGGMQERAAIPQSLAVIKTAAILKDTLLG